MAFKRAIGRPTAAQQRRQDRARERGCICCLMGQHSTAGAIEIHHLTECGRTIDQDHTVALCSWHHRGVCLDGYTTTMMTAAYGPSLAKGSKPFYARYGRNAELLNYQNSLLEAYATN